MGLFLAHLNIIGIFYAIDDFISNRSSQLSFDFYDQNLNCSDIHYISTKKTSLDIYVKIDVYLTK